VVGRYGRVGLNVTLLVERGRGHGPAHATTLHRRTAGTTVLVLTTARTSVCSIRVQVDRLFSFEHFYLRNQWSLEWNIKTVGTCTRPNVCALFIGYYYKYHYIWLRNNIWKNIHGDDKTLTGHVARNILRAVKSTELRHECSAQSWKWLPIINRKLHYLANLCYFDTDS